MLRCAKPQLLRANGLIAPPKKWPGAHEAQPGDKTDKREKKQVLCFSRVPHILASYRSSYPCFRKSDSPNTSQPSPRNECLSVWRGETRTASVLQTTRGRGSMTFETLTCTSKSTHNTPRRFLLSPHGLRARAGHFGRMTTDYWKLRYHNNRDFAAARGASPVPPEIFLHHPSVKYAK